MVVLLRMKDNEQGLFSMILIGVILQNSYFITDKE